MAYPIRLDEAFILCSNLPLPSSSRVFQFSQASLQTPKHFAQAISAFGRHRRWQEGHLLLDEMTRYRWVDPLIHHAMAAKWRSDFSPMTLSKAHGIQWGGWKRISFSNKGGPHDPITFNESVFGGCNIFSWGYSIAIHAKKNCDFIMGVYPIQNALFWVGSAAPFYRSHPKVQLGDFPTSPAIRRDPRKFRRWLKQGPRETPVILWIFTMWVCLKIVYPYTQWLMIIIPTKGL